MPTLTIPRLGSVRQSDAEYDPVVARIGPRFDVFVNGQVQTHVIAYNCAEGWIRRFVTNRLGKIQVAKGYPFVREELRRGIVTVAWR